MPVLCSSAAAALRSMSGRIGRGRSNCCWMAWLRSNQGGRCARRIAGLGCRRGAVAAFYPQWNVAIIDVGYYEGAGVLVVSTSTGSSVTPLAWPHFSPSGKEFAAVESCQAEYCTDGVEIWSTAVDPPMRVYQSDPQASRWYWFDGW